MTVAELKKELECYDDDMEVVFNLDDPSVEVDRWTEDKWGNREVSIDKTLSRHSSVSFAGICVLSWG